MGIRSRETEHDHRYGRKLQIRQTIVRWIRSRSYLVRYVQWAAYVVCQRSLLVDQILVRGIDRFEDFGKTMRLNVFWGIIEVVFIVDINDRMVDQMRANSREIMHNGYLHFFQVFSRADS